MRHGAAPDAGRSATSQNFGERRHQKYPSCFLRSMAPASSWSMSRPWRSETLRRQRLCDDAVEVGGIGLDGGRQRPATERAEANLAERRRSRRGAAACGRRRARAGCRCARRSAARRRSRAGPRRAARARCSATRPSRSNWRAERRAPSRRCPRRPLSRRHISGRCLRGSQRWPSERNENTRSLAREASSSRRAPPNAASKPCRSSACRSPCVFMTSV